ncbi:MAG: hypothetical protein Q8S73_20385 [Deltaproteobacteria bacterium]|nr:hypothetical protein [Myxococcales bacterium]MDP3216478.1 hypothetical protein [Deltaproteobacteria bacterium]
MSFTCPNCHAEAPAVPLRCSECGASPGARSRARVGLRPAPLAVRAASPSPSPADVDRPDHVEGVVFGERTAATRAPPRNPWKLAAGLVLVLELLPFLLAWWALVLALRIALLPFGWGRGGSGGGGSWWWIVPIFVGDRREQIPVYRYGVRTARGTRAVEQRGDFTAGALVPGHRVTLDGRDANGVLLVESGYDHDERVTLRRPWDPWPWVLAVLLAGGYVEVCGLTSLAATAHASLPAHP